MRYHLENTSLDTAGEARCSSRRLRAARRDPLGEEVGDFFDVDFGL